MLHAIQESRTYRPATKGQRSSCIPIGVYFQDELYAIEEEKLAKPQEHIDLSLGVINTPTEDSARRINVAEAVPKDHPTGAKKNKNCTSTKLDRVKVSTQETSIPHE